MNTFDRFPRLLDALIELNRTHRHEVAGSGVRQQFGSMAFAAQFCTVTCDIGRGVGKTEYIKSHANEGCLVVVPNDDMAKALYGRNTPFTVCSARQLQGVAAEKRFHTIFVDDPAYVFLAIDRTKFYSWLVVDGMEQTFVLLGAPC